MVISPRCLTCLVWPYVLQNGSAGINYLWAATAVADGSVILAGYTSGNWSGSNQGGKDFAVVNLIRSVWRSGAGRCLMYFNLLC